MFIYKTILYFFFLIIFFCSSNEEEVVFNIRFDCCWDNDTVTLIINEQEIFKNEILSNPTNSLFGWSIAGVNVKLLDNKQLEVTLPGNKVFTKNFDFNKKEELLIEVKVNHETHQKKANLRKGKFFVVDQYENGDVIISQYKDRPPIH